MNEYMPRVTRAPGRRLKFSAPLQLHVLRRGASDGQRVQAACKWKELVKSM